MIKTLIAYRFCSYINNKAYELSKMDLKSRLKSFHQNYQLYSNKDKAALIMTLKQKEIYSKALNVGNIIENLQLNTLQHKELSIIANFLSIQQIQSPQLWKGFAQRGFKIIEDFDRDSLPKFLDAIDRSEQVEIKQFWDLILQYARRNFNELNGECALSLFCNLIRRYPSSVQLGKQQPKAEQDKITNQQTPTNTTAAAAESANKLQQLEEVPELEDNDNTEQPRSGGGDQYDNLTEKLMKSSQLLKEADEGQASIKKEEWEQETNDIMFDIFNQIIKKHIKNFDGNQILRFISYLVAYRENWIQVNMQNNLKIALVYLEEQMDSIENLTTFLLTLMQSLDKVSAQPEFFIKVIDVILKNKIQINAHNIHLVCALFEALDVREKSVIWKEIIKILIKEYPRITSVECQSIIVSSLTNCNIITAQSSSAAGQKAASFESLIKQLSVSYQDIK